MEQSNHFSSRRSAAVMIGEAQNIYFMSLVVVMVAAQRTRLDQQRRAAQRGKFQQFCSAVPRSVNEDETTSLP